MSDFETSMSRARFLAQANRPAEALDALATARASDPTAADAHLLAARCLHQLKRYGEALHAAEQAAGCAPDWAAPHVVEGYIYLGLGDPSHALAAGNRALRLAPDNADAHIVLGQAMSSLGQRQEALAHAHQAVELAPQSADAFVALSAVALRAGRWKESEEASRQALALDPNSAAALNNLGVALRHRFRPLAAVRTLGHAIRANPTSRVSQGNANGTIMILGGWLLSLFVLTVFLLVWYVQPARGLDRPALLALLVVGAVLTVTLSVLFARWLLGLPRAIRHSLVDESAWERTFRGHPSGRTDVAARIFWFELARFGVPTAILVYLVWCVLWVLNGSEHAHGHSAASVLVFPALLFAFSLVGRTAGRTVRS